MDIAIHGKQVDVGDSLRAHIETSLQETHEKYFGRATRTTVTISREGHGHGLFKVHIFVVIGMDIVLNADATAPEPYQAFEKAAERAAKRWRRLKRQVRDDHKKDEASVFKTYDFVLSSLAAVPGAEEPEEEEHGDSGVSEEGDPVIIAEGITDIAVLSVAEAVARMELSSQGAYLFRHAGHGGLNMVYRRSDGHVGWMDPGPAKGQGCCGEGKGKGHHHHDEEEEGSCCGGGRGGCCG